ncbi:hypothetical protein ACFLSX_04825 [Calditrichota bacterium]
MLRFLIFLMTLFLIFAFFACGGEKKEEAAKTEAQVEEATAGMIDCDGECGMKMAEADMVTYVQEGDTLHFCSEKCKEHYLAAEKEEGDMEEEPES